jgi:hypothetical protein
VASDNPPEPGIRFGIDETVPCPPTGEIRQGAGGGDGRGGRGDRGAGGSGRA